MGAKSEVRAGIEPAIVKYESTVIAILTILPLYWLTLIINN